MVDQLLIRTVDHMVETRTGRRILLMTGGLLVSGVPVDEHEFLADVRAGLSTLEPVSVSEAASVVHLKDVIISDNGNTRRLASWRGSLDAVSGWSLVGSDVLDALEESWRRNEAGYRYLAGR